MESESNRRGAELHKALDKLHVNSAVEVIVDEEALAGLSDEELKLIDETYDEHIARELAATRPPIDTKALAEQLVAAASSTEDEKIVVKAAGDTAEALKLVIADAKAGDKRALNKLKAFETFEDPQLAARVALMNNKQRRAFMAARRGKNRSRRGKR